MEKQRRIRHHLLSWLCVFLLSGSCVSIEQEGIPGAVKLVFTESNYATRSYDPEEERLNDLHIFIFSPEGELEYSDHLKASDLESSGPDRSCEVQLIQDRSYDFYVCANLGYAPQVRNLAELENLVCHLSWPDDYRQGIPMSCTLKGVRIDRKKPVILHFRRLMAKISLRIDRSRLSEDVELLVRSVKIGNCPKRAKVFGQNTIQSTDALFPNGFVRNEEECIPLNENRKNGVSDAVFLYMLENLQGRIAGTDGTAAGKIFPPEDERSRYASYIEISMDYLSSRYFTGEKTLKYRFWLGEDHRDVNVERNCHYHMKICPTDDGLGAEGWRIDKTGLQDLQSEVEFRILPGRYLEARVGEDLHVWCDYSPTWAKFDVGLEELENDKARGLYDYTLDEDGRGVVLHLKNPGQGILYMEAGPPVNRSDMAYIEILPAT